MRRSRSLLFSGMPAAALALAAAAMGSLAPARPEPLSFALAAYNSRRPGEGRRRVSRHQPHQGARECARRLRQLAKLKERV